MAAKKITRGTHRGLYFQAAIFFSFFLICACNSNAESIERLGDAYVIYLPKSADFDEVVADVKTEVSGVNWQVVNELNIGETVKEFGVETENKVISVCNVEYLSQAVQADPMISLIIPCRFTVFREHGADQRIVVGFYDPLAEAAALDLKQVQAAEVATEDLKAVLGRIAEMHQN